MRSEGGAGRAIALPCRRGGGRGASVGRGGGGSGSAVDEGRLCHLRAGSYVVHRRCGGVGWRRRGGAVAAS